VTAVYVLYPWRRAIVSNALGALASPCCLAAQHGLLEHMMFCIECLLLSCAPAGGVWRPAAPQPAQLAAQVSGTCPSSSSRRRAAVLLRRRAGQRSSWQPDAAACCPCCCQVTACAQHVAG
jgi:ubiquitin